MPYRLDERISALVVRGRYHTWVLRGTVWGNCASSPLELYRVEQLGKGVGVAAETSVRKVSK